MRKQKTSTSNSVYQWEKHAFHEVAPESLEKIRAVRTGLQGPEAVTSVCVSGFGALVGEQKEDCPEADAGLLCVKLDVSDDYLRELVYYSIFVKDTDDFWARGWDRSGCNSLGLLHSEV